MHLIDEKQTKREQRGMPLKIHLHAKCDAL